MWYQWKPLGMVTLASTQVLLSTSFASLRLCKARSTYTPCLMMKMASSLRKRNPSVNSYLKPPYGSNEQSAIRIPLARTKPQPGMLTPVNTGNAPVPRLKPRRTRCLTSVRMKMRTQRPCIARMWRLAGGFWGTIIPARLHPSTR